MTMILPASFLTRLSTGQEVITIEVNPDLSPTELVKALKLPQPSSLLLLSGGAGLMSEESYRRLVALFEAVGQVLVQANTTVIDGGTQAGVAELMGKALARSHRKAPYIGVLPAYAEVSPGGPEGKDILEPNHSHVVLVSSNHWGDEVKLMYGLANYLALQAPSVTMLVNGGTISLKEVERNVEQGREIIVIAGSGRLADEIATAVDHPELDMRDQIRKVVQRGRLTVFNLSSPIVELVELLRQRLTPKTPAV